MPQVTKDPGAAAVLSLIVPGIGQFYNGDFLRGLFWLIITPGFWIGSGGMLGLGVPRHRRDHRPPAGGSQECVCLTNCRPDRTAVPVTGQTAL